MTEQQTQPPHQEFDCRFYPLCLICYDLSYCPKKAKGGSCIDYVQYTRPPCEECIYQARSEHEKATITAQAREKVLDEVYDELTSSQEIRGDCMRDAIRVVNSLRSTSTPKEAQR